MNNPNVVPEMTANRPADEEVYFQTELYYEAIDGVYQERKSNAASSIYLSSKKIKEKSNLDNFKNLNASEISNLIYLSDLKCFSALQSIYTLFLNKSNTIENLIGQVCDRSSGGEFVGPRFDRTHLSEFSAEVIDRILSLDINFVESIRILPDLNIVLRKHTLKESKNNSSGYSIVSLLVNFY